MERTYRKVSKFGNSLGVTLTKDALTKLNLTLGDDVEIVVNEEAHELVLRKASRIPSKLDPRFFETLEANVTQYRRTIEGLVDR